MENMILDRTIRANAIFSIEPSPFIRAVYNESLPSYTKSKHYREYFRGGWDQYRVNFALGCDLQINSIQHGSPLNTFGYSYAQIVCKTFD
jgi:hypothetical protein